LAPFELFTLLAELGTACFGADLALHIGERSLIVFGKSAKSKSVFS
jgi:hypothetical protein